MGYSARRGFTNGKVSGAQRQAELQQKIAQMQEQMNAAQEAVELAGCQVQGRRGRGQRR